MTRLVRTAPGDWQLEPFLENPLHCPAEFLCLSYPWSSLHLDQDEPVGAANFYQR